MKNLIGDCENYEQYLDVLQELYKPSVWSYDVYLYVQTNENAPKVMRYGHSYNCLRMFSYQYKKTGSPFWAFGMTAAHATYKKAGIIIIKTQLIILKKIKRDYISEILRVNAELSNGNPISSSK